MDDLMWTNGKFVMYTDLDRVALGLTCAAILRGCQMTTASTGRYLIPMLPELERSGDESMMDPYSRAVDWAYIARRDPGLAGAGRPKRSAEKVEVWCF